MKVIEETIKGVIDLFCIFVLLVLCLVVFG